MQIKKIVIGTAASALMLGSMTLPAFANGTQYASNPGLNVSSNQTICSGHGAFQYFEGQPGIIPHVYIAADRQLGTTLGAETSLANSNLCGNPQK